MGIPFKVHFFTLSIPNNAVLVNIYTNLECITKQIEESESRDQEENRRDSEGYISKARRGCIEVATALGVSPTVATENNLPTETHVEELHGPKTRRLDKFSERVNDGKSEGKHSIWERFISARRKIFNFEEGGASHGRWVERVCEVEGRVCYG